eukprot:scaffold514938_cov30-Prasinocladus_malaysianus.AAC.2
MSYGRVGDGKGRDDRYVDNKMPTLSVIMKDHDCTTSPGLEESSAQRQISFVRIMAGFMAKSFRKIFTSSKTMAWWVRMGRPSYGHPGMWSYIQSVGGQVLAILGSWLSVIRESERRWRR